MKKSLLVALSCFFIISHCFAQSHKIDNSILWKVEGKGLKAPSYLFGTYHLLSNSFVDTLAEVMHAYKSAGAVVGELVMDSTLQKPSMEASILVGSKLKDVLPDTLYAKANKWFKEEAGLDLIRLDPFNPITVMITALHLTQQKHFPNKPGETLIDSYFQQMGKKDGKKVMGLETIDVQINALFKQLSLARQVELLNELFRDPEAIVTNTSLIYKSYVANDLNLLEKQMSTYGTGYTPAEMKVMVDDRNVDWVQKLPALMKEESLFVAVGAFHLAGKMGLVNQLRDKGYKVTALKLN